MLSADATHLRKYLATLGIAVVAATLSIAGLAMRLQSELLVTKAELAKMTPTAHETIVRRQHYEYVITAVLPWFVLGGCFIGVALALYGLKGWAERQKVADEIEDNERLRTRNEVRKLTEEERADRVETEVDSLVASEVIEELGVESALESQPESQPESKPEQQPESQPEREPLEVRPRPPRPDVVAQGRIVDSSSSSRGEFRALVEMAERELYEKVQDAFSDSHEVLFGVRIGRGSASRTVDVLATPRSSQGRHLAFEVTVGADLRRLHQKIVNVMSHLAVGAALLSEQALPVVVAIYQEPADPTSLERVREQIRLQAETFRRPPRFMILRDDEFQRMSAKSFRSQLRI